MKIRLMLIAVCLFALTVPAMAGEQYIFFGLGADGASSPAWLGMGGIGIPISESALWYTDYDVSVIEGTTIKTVLQPNALQFSTRTGIAQRVTQVDVWGRKLSVLALAQAGIGAGPGTPDGETALVPQTVTKPSFALGGMVDFPLGKGWGLIAIIEQVKNISPEGFRFIPRIALRYRLQ